MSASIQYTCDLCLTKINKGITLRMLKSSKGYSCGSSSSKLQKIPPGPNEIIMHVCRECSKSVYNEYLNGELDKG